MALTSRLFRGDERLEACLVSDPAHITRGQSGECVAKIQWALSLLDGAKVDRREIAAKQYGPSTAAAVLTYKTKRRIVNFTYQTSADDIVGKMTIAALDREMLLFEHRLREHNSCSGRRGFPVLR